MRMIHWYWMLHTVSQKTFLSKSGNYFHQVMIDSVWDFLHVFVYFNMYFAWCDFFR